MMRESLQTLLVRRSFLTVGQIGDAMVAARRSGTTWLEQLLVAGVLDEERLAAWVAHEGKIPRCGVDELASIDRDVLGRIPVEVAIEHRLLPTMFDDEGYLHIAMVDPLDEAAFQEAEFFANVPLCRQVAVASSVAWALHRHHGARTLLWPRQAVVVEPGVAAAR